ncbi:MAG: dihydrofolate reductase family protein, partial [Candidatus Sulfotelmatobacter sp.]
FMPDEEFFDYAKDMLRSVDTILFGRATYEHMAAYWPSAERDEIAEKMNGLQKLVVSSTLKKTEWNNSTLITGDFVQEISRLKEEPGKDIVILGSATLASDLLQRGLIDEYRVILAPLLLGRGHPLFRDIRQKLALRLGRTKLLRSGVIVLYYQKA